jgi:CubicO group peptidase (beta-lactamase class C family)
MQNYLKTLQLIIFISISASLIAQPKAEKIDELMNYCNKNGIFNGTILVSDNGEIIYRKAFGMANKEKNEMLEPEHQFYLGSVSKQFTSMAIMLLKEEGKLDYSDKLIKYFPEFESFASDVTIKHMMNHTSGLPNHYRLVEQKAGLNNEDALNALLKHGKLDFEPGERFGYSNGAYVMLAMIAEKASDESLHNYLKKKVFVPLEMNSTLVYDKKYEIAKPVVGYNLYGDEDDYHFFTTGAGGIYSNIDDLYKWDQALYTDKVIPQEYLKEAFTPAMLHDSSLSYYGYGWTIHEERNRVMHGGSLAGFRTFIQRDIDNNSSIIFLTNNGNALAIGGVIEGINAILEGNEFNFPRAVITVKLHKEIKDNGISEAIKYYNDAKKNHQDKYEFGEFPLNMMGYYYLYELNDIDTAIELFKLNVVSYPASSNVYDSLGEAYKVKGDNELAIKNYKKSYDLDNRNTNALKMIEEINDKSNSEK